MHPTSIYWQYAGGDAVLASVTFLHAGGQAAPSAAQRAISSPNTSWLPGTGSRPAPGFHPQPTRESWAMCSTISSIVLPPLRSGSLICSQICAERLAFPGHLDRRQMPGRVPRNALQGFGLIDDVDIGRTVACVAHHAGHADVAVAARHGRLMLVHRHALQRAVAGGVAIHAARMLDDLAGLFEQGDGARRLVLDRGKRRGVAQAGARRPHCWRQTKRRLRHLPPVAIAASAESAARAHGTHHDTPPGTMGRRLTGVAGQLVARHWRRRGRSAARRALPRRSAFPSMR